MKKKEPYQVLMRDEKAYRILLARDQGESYTVIARKYGISAIKAEQIYRRMKMRQARLYADEIEGREEWKNVRAVSA